MSKEEERGELPLYHPPPPDNLEPPQSKPRISATSTSPSNLSKAKTQFARTSAITNVHHARNASKSEFSAVATNVSASSCTLLRRPKKR